VVTLLTEKEGALDIRNQTMAAGLKWVWFPMPEAGKKMSPAENEAVREFLSEKLAPMFESSVRSRIYLHGSAELQRAGMMTYALLLQLDYDEAQSMEILRKLSPAAAAELDSAKIRWAENIVAGY